MGHSLRGFPVLLGRHAICPLVASLCLHWRGRLALLIDPGHIDWAALLRKHDRHEGQALAVKEPLCP